MKRLFKSQFADDGAGKFKKRFHIEPKDDQQVIRDLEPGTVKYEGNNEAVATTEKVEGDEKKFDLVWVGPGLVTVKATGDADLDPGEDNYVSGEEEFKLEDDEATSITIVEGD